MVSCVGIYSKIVVLVLAITVKDARMINPDVLSDRVVFQNGIPFSYQNYRIPVLAFGPLNQTLVVVVEERLYGTGDYQPKNIAYKYSDDFGITW